MSTHNICFYGELTKIILQTIIIKYPPCLFFYCLWEVCKTTYCKHTYFSRLITSTFWRWNVISRQQIFTLILFVSLTLMGVQKFLRWFILQKFLPREYHKYKSIKTNLNRLTVLDTLINGELSDSTVSVVLAGARTCWSVTPLFNWLILSFNIDNYQILQFLLF